MTSTATTIPIAIAYPDAPELVLRLRLGPCRLRVVASDGPAWVTGTYEDPGQVLPIKTRVEAGAATISQRFDPAAFSAALALPQLDLGIGRSRPFALVIEAGASENAFDLGGLPLTGVDLRAGAGKYDLDFSTPNLAEMRTCELAAGAGALTARRLANANFAYLRLGGGVASCTLDFAGELRRDASARVDAGLAAVEIVVPAATATRVISKAFAANTDVIGPVTRKGDAYFTPPALEGKHPLLSIEVSMALGQLTIRAT
jgi:hypothetical protein